MNQRQMLQELTALPPAAQQEVFDFIAFLRSRCVGAEPAQEQLSTDLATEKFIGMWSDRADMSDSSAWLRSVRMNEWG